MVAVLLPERSVDGDLLLGDCGEGGSVMRLIPVAQPVGQSFGDPVVNRAGHFESFAIGLPEAEARIGNPAHLSHFLAFAAFLVDRVPQAWLESIYYKMGEFVSFIDP